MSHSDISQNNSSHNNVTLKLLRTKHFKCKGLNTKSSKNSTLNVLRTKH